MLPSVKIPVTYTLINLCVLLILSVIRTTNSGANNLHRFESITTHDVISGFVYFEIIDPEELEYTYRLRVAKDFGRSFNSETIKVKQGFLVPANPFDGCSKLKNSADVRGNVALIQRGDCSFLSKTIIAERAGALAVIITDLDKTSDLSDVYIEMISDNTDRETNIPAAYLLGMNGRMIVDTLIKLSQNYAIINLPVNLTFTPPELINHPPWHGW